MTPDELRAKIKTNTEALLAASKALEAADASKAAGAADAKKAEDDKKDATAKAYKEAAEFSAKAHKAVGALHEHVAKSDHIEEGHKEACAKAFKAMTAAHKALGGKPGSEEEAEDEAGEDKKKEAAAMADAFKSALAPLQEQIKQLEARAYQPKGAGPGGAAVVTATKGAIAPGAVVVPDNKTAQKAIAKMTTEEREEARKAAYARTKTIGIPADQFQVLGNDALKALGALAEQAAEGETVVEA